MKKKHSLIVLLLVLSLLVGLSPSGHAKAAEKAPSDYVSVGGDGKGQVTIAKSIGDFLTLVGKDKADINISGGTDNETISSITAKTPGLVILNITYNSSTNYITVSTSSKLDTSPTFYSWNWYRITNTKGIDSLMDYCTFSDTTQTLIHFMDADSSLYFKIYGKGFIDYPDATIRVGFIPVEQLIAEPTISRKNGKVVLHFDDINDKGDLTNLRAIKGELSASEYDDNGWDNVFTLSGSQDETGAYIELDKDGKYTFKIAYEEAGGAISFGLITLDTNKIGLKKLDAPLSALYKTNVVVGYATPGATVHVKYSDKEYTAVADQTGLYKVVTAKLGKKKTFKIWQTNGSEKSEVLSYKTTTK